MAAAVAAMAAVTTAVAAVTAAMSPVAAMRLWQQHWQRLAAAAASLSGSSVVLCTGSVTATLGYT
jgi:hypothetical protein